MKRIEVLYNSIDVDDLQASVGQNRPELCQELDLPEESLILLNVARVSPQKGLLYAIRALPAIKHRHPTAHLLSVGATTDKSWLARLAMEAQSLGVSEHVHMIGPRRDIPDFLRLCDVFVFPSLYEGLGIALIEAMAAGCACVATTTGPIPEVVRHGVDGWLVPPGNTEELAGAVCTLLANPERRKQLGEVAATSTLSRFHPQEAAERLAGMYAAVLNEPRSTMHDAVMSARNNSGAMLR